MYSVDGTIGPAMILCSQVCHLCLAQLSIMLYSMKTTSALRAEITVQWQPLFQLQDTTLVCNVIKHPLRMYVSSRGWAAEMILFILWFPFQSPVKCSLVLIPKAEKQSH